MTKKNYKKIEDEAIDKYKYCPLFKEEKVRKVLKKLPTKINPKTNKNWAYIASNRHLWVYRKGEWRTLWGDVNFPGFTAMIGIKKLRPKELELANSLKPLHGIKVEIPATKKSQPEKLKRVVLLLPRYMGIITPQR